MRDKIEDQESSKLRINYKPRPRHWRWVIRETHRTSTLILRTLGLTLIVLAAIGLAARLPSWPLALPGLGLILLPDLIARINLKRLPEQLAYSERSVMLSAEGVEISTAYMRCSYNTDIISDVVEGQEGWLVLVASQPCVMIPRDVVTVADEQGIAQFAERVRIGISARITPAEGADTQKP